MARYDAFISYRHGGEDQAIGERLHRLLESYRTPASLVRRGVPARLNRVFRDREELPTASNLSDSILQALQDSRFLIVICSPRAKESRWIAKEIEIFRKLGREDRILALLIDGQPVDAFPEGLIVPKLTEFRSDDGSTHAIEQLVEPLSADIRAPEPGDRRRLLKIEILRLLAPILGCTFDDLRQRHRERARRRMWAFGGGMMALTSAFGALALFATLQWFAAEDARADAAHQRDAARATQSNLMARTAEDLLDRGDSNTALQVAVEALQGRGYEGDRPPYQPAAHRALKKALAGHRLVRTFRYPGAHVWGIALVGERALVLSSSGAAEFRPLKGADHVLASVTEGDGAQYGSAWISESGRTVALVTLDGRLRYFDGMLRPLSPAVDLPAPVAFLKMDEAAGTAFTVLRGQSGSELALYRIADGSRLRTFATDATAWALSGDGRWLAHIGGVTVRVDRLDGSAPAFQAAGHGASFLSLNRDGTRLALGTPDDTSVQILRLDSDTPPIRFFAGQYRVVSVRFSHAGHEYGEALITKDENGQAVWLLEGDAVHPVYQTRNVLNFLPGGLIEERTWDEAALAARVRVSVLRPQSRGGYGMEEVLRMIAPGLEDPIAADAQGRFLATVSGGRALVYSTDDPLLVHAHPFGDEHTIRLIDVTPDGSRMVAASERADGSHALLRIDPASLSILETYPLDAAPQSDLVAEPDGTRVGFLAEDGSAHVHDTARPAASPIVVPSTQTPSPVVFTGGRALVAIRDGDMVRVWAADSGEATATLAVPHGFPGRPWLSRDGRRVFLGAEDVPHLLKAEIGVDRSLRTLLFDADEFGALPPWWTGERIDWQFAASESGLCAVMSVAYESAAWHIPFRNDGAHHRPLRGTLIGSVTAAGRYCFAVEAYRSLIILSDDNRIVERAVPLVSELDFQSGVPAVSAFAAGTRLALFHQYGNRSSLKVMRTEADVDTLLPRALQTAGDCITPFARQNLGLDPTPPSWCIETRRWPYDSPDWLTWLDRRREEPLVQPPVSSDVRDLPPAE